MKKFIIVIFLLIFLILCIFVYNYSFKRTEDNKRISVKLDKCIDGDTVWFSRENKSKKYRFLAINSPELEEYYGNESKEFTCDLLNKAKNIEIEYDVVGELVDKYNRELVWVYVDGELLQEKILSQGFAEIKYIYANYEYLNKLYSIEEYAKSKRIGIWKDYSKYIEETYYMITFNYFNVNKKVKVFKNSTLDLIDNPYKDNCRFIGWMNGNYLFDLSTKINKNYNLEAKFEC